MDKNKNEIVYFTLKFLAITKNKVAFKICLQ